MMPRETPSTTTTTSRRGVGDAAGRVRFGPARASSTMTLVWLRTGGRARSRACPPVGGGEFVNEFAPEGVIVDLDRVPGRRIEPLMWVCDFVADARTDVGRAFQPPADLQRRDACLVVGEPPDAADRLEVADEEQAGHRRVHH